MHVVIEGDRVVIWVDVLLHQLYLFKREQMRVVIGDDHVVIEVDVLHFRVYHVIFEISDFKVEINDFKIEMNDFNFEMVPCKLKWMFSYMESLISNMN